MEDGTRERLTSTNEAAPDGTGGGLACLPRLQGQCQEGDGEHVRPVDTEQNTTKTELRLDEGGVWAIHSTSATIAYLDLDRELLLRHWGPGSPRFPNDGRFVPLVRVTSTRGDTGVIRVGDRHELLTDPGGPDYQYWIPRACTSIEPVDRADIPVADPNAGANEGQARPRDESGR